MIPKCVIDYYVWSCQPNQRQNKHVTPTRMAGKI